MVAAAGAAPDLGPNLGRDLTENAVTVEAELFDEPERAGVVDLARVHHVIDRGMAPTVLYASGEQVEMPTEQIWRPVCGTQVGSLDAAALERIAQEHEAVMQAEDVIIVDSRRPRDGAGFNLSFALAGSVPSAAVPAFAAAEEFYECLFSDPITVSVSVTFQNLGSGVLGATGSNFVQVSYPNARNGLINGMDPDDTIQDFLPTGSTIPVRYNASSTTVTNENRVFFTVASFRSTIGTVGGSAASMTYNTQFNWDYDPTNGVPGNAQSFVDVVIHEVGHAMGFVSGVDFRTNDIEALDMARFQRTDGSGDYDPDTTAEFQVRERTVDFNNPNDNHNFDIISREVRMSDGSPWQASHWREQGSNLGIMDPALSAGQTFIGRDYFTDADIDAFDFIGWDYPPCVAPTFTGEPTSQTLCPGDTLVLTATVTESASFQWTKDGANLTDGGDISGATASTLIISNADASDAGNYACSVTANDDGCSIVSATANISFGDLPTILTDLPPTTVVDEGDNAVFAIVSFPSEHTFQWRKDGVPLTDGGDVSGATTTVLIIANADASDEGSYDCVVTNNPAPNCDLITSASALTVNPVADCAADIDGDGDVDPDDINAFVAAFTDGVPLNADIDNDGDEDPDDITAFVNAFVAGC